MADELTRGPCPEAGARRDAGAGVTVARAIGALALVAIVAGDALAAWGRGPAAPEEGAHGPGLAVLLGIVLVSLAGVIVAIVRLARAVPPPPTDLHRRRRAARVA